MTAVPTPRMHGRSWPGDEQAGGPHSPPEPGDIIVLGHGVSLLEQRGRCAVVTATAEAHVTAVLLDDMRRKALGECWPSRGDVRVESAVGRLGSRVAIAGLTAAKSSWCNGLSGIVVARTQGHPVFLSRRDSGPSSPKAGPADDQEHPILVFCVQLDRPPAKRKAQQWIEHRFLVPYRDFVGKATTDLHRCLLASDPDHCGFAPLLEEPRSKAASSEDPVLIKDMAAKKSGDRIEDGFSTGPITTDAVTITSNKSTPREVQHACDTMEMISTVKLKIKQIQGDYDREAFSVREKLASVKADVAWTKIELGRTNESIEAIKQELDAMRILVGGHRDDSRRTTARLDELRGDLLVFDGKISRLDASKWQRFGEHSSEEAVWGDSSELLQHTYGLMRQLSHLRPKWADAADHINELRIRVDEMAGGRYIVPAVARLGEVRCGGPTGTEHAAELERRLALGRRLRHASDSPPCQAAASSARIEEVDGLQCRPKAVELEHRAGAAERERFLEEVSERERARFLEELFRVRDAQSPSRPGGSASCMGPRRSGTTPNLGLKSGSLQYSAITTPRDLIEVERRHRPFYA